MLWQGGLPTFTWFGSVAADHCEAGTSYHETGHFLLAHLAGFTINDIQVILHPELEATEGYVELGDHRRRALDPRGLNPAMLVPWLIAVVAGQVAHAMWYERYKGKTFDEGMALTESGACHDQGLFTKFGGKNPPITMQYARRAAQVELHRLWPYVDRNAGVLFEGKTMTQKQIITPGKRG